MINDSNDSNDNDSNDNDSNDEVYDVAVIGAGMAGLSAAIEASGAGRRVVVLDARQSIGGRARTHERGGYSMNEGAHALYVDGPANAFLSGLGCEPAGGVPDAASGIAVDGETEGAFPSGIGSMLRTPILKGDRIAMAKLFATLPRLAPEDFADRSVDDVIADLLGDGRAGRLAQALFRLSTYFNDPAVTSADAGLVQLQMVVNNGVRYLHGGWQTMVDDLEKVGRNRGVDIRGGAKVASVDPVDDGYLLSGSSTPVLARSVVVAASPGLAGELLGEISPVVGEWAAAARPAMVSSLDVGFPDVWGDRRPFALGIDEPTYLSLHAPVADLAPDGHTLVHVMRYLPTNETPDADRDRAACEALLDRVRPDWRSAADHVAFSPRLVASTDQPAADRGGLPGRPDVAVPGLAGVFVAGDWVGAEGVLVDAAVASGRAAGRAAAR